MRLALLSDIHGNVHALDAVLADIEAQGGVGAYWILGDLVASGFGWTRGAITQGGYFDWLAALPLTIADTLPDGTRVLGCHASPHSEDGLGFHRDLGPEDLDAVIGDADADLFFGGHHHLTLDAATKGRRVVNLGSLSNHVLPEIHASYVLLEADATTHRLAFRRIDYDVEEVIREMHRVHYPGTAFVSPFLRGERKPMGEESLPRALAEFKAQRKGKGELTCATPS